MKKLILMLVMISVIIVLVSTISFASALDATISRSTKGFALSQVTNGEAYSGGYSLRLYAAEDKVVGTEGRVRIEFNTPIPLSSLTSISWMQKVAKGYAAHVDVLVDTDGNGVSDDALVFEYDKVKLPSDQAVAQMLYQRGKWVNTFDDKGIVNDDATGWLNSGDPGPVGGAKFNAKTLSGWKTAYPNGKVTALEIEVDGWILESEAFIDDITINGENVMSFENTQALETGVGPDVSLSISPATLNFGTLVAGTINNPGLDVMFDATGSNVDVSVEVDSVVGFPYETGLKFNGANPKGQKTTLPCLLSGGVCSYTPVEWTTSLTVPTGTRAGTYSGTITYIITGPAPAP